MVRSEKIILVDACRNNCQADRSLERFINVKCQDKRPDPQDL